MGDEISKEDYTAEDYQQFQQKLDVETDFVRSLFADKRFDNKTFKLGYELELCLVDKDGLPAPLNQQILDLADNSMFTYELAKFNLEINGNAFECCADVFDLIYTDLSGLYSEVRNAAQRFDAEVGLFGVLPSLSHQHLDPDHYMSDLHRYRLLDRRLMEMRQRPVHMEIHGRDHLILERNDLMLEALSTSLQTHLQIPFDQSVDYYHAALWASMSMLAVGANSPLVLGTQCWQESRVAIFKQAVDTRNPQEIRDEIIPRVHFGKGYISSWLELFEDNDYYSAILPEVKPTSVEQLSHFNLHNGTIWRWVRPILGHDNGQYHLRLELRVTPSGPSLVDTMANLVFFVGLIEGLVRSSQELTQLPFEDLQSDFYRVAREGLAAEVHWFDGDQDSIQRVLLNSAIPIAEAGLQHLGIESTERWIDIIRDRVRSARTGADWINHFWRSNQDPSTLVQAYLNQARRNKPVHLWSR